MTDLAAALEATELAAALRRSRWLYPGVNAGHILGIGLLIGAVVPMDLRLLGLRRRFGLAAVVGLLRPVAAVGLALAAVCGGLLFIAQASDYVSNRYFQAKMAVLALALANIALHPRLVALSLPRRRLVAAVSLGVWPTVLFLGRMIAYS